MVDFDTRRLGLALGHGCGVIGIMIGADALLCRFAEGFERIFAYPGLSALILSFLMLALGTRLVRENQPPRRIKGPWGK